MMPNNTTNIKPYLYVPAIILLLLLHSCKEPQLSGREPNYIDSITGEDEIRGLLYPDDHYRHFTVNSEMAFPDKALRRISDSLKIKPWIKGDFDHNGFTDILVIGDPGYGVICILDKGKKYEIKSLTGYHQSILPVLRKTKEARDAVRYYYLKEPQWKHWKSSPVVAYQDLTYRYGGFIEENKNPASHTIQKIEYETTACFGSCPIFDLAIHSDSTALWYARAFNEIGGMEVKGCFKTVISQDKFAEIVGLLNYMDFETLNDHYDIGATDHPTGIIKITYDGGKTKTIEDYGLSGTMGLKSLHWLLSDLRKNQVWLK